VGLGVEGMATDAVSAGIIGAVFGLGLMIAGRLADYKEAERAPTDLAAGLYAILRQGESIHATWRKPDLTALRRRLIAVVTLLRAEIDAGRHTHRPGRDRGAEGESIGALLQQGPPTPAVANVDIHSEARGSSHSGWAPTRSRSRADTARWSPTRRRRMSG
jgi:hypothetical protein